MKKKYFLVIIGLGALLALIVLSRASGNNFVLSVAPEAAEVTLDNQRKLSSGSYSLPEGRHTVTAKLEGFASVTKSFSISGGKTEKLDILLNPNSEAGYEYLRNHPDEQLRRENLGGKAFDQGASQAGSKNPLIYELPFIDQLYRVDYGPSQLHPGDSSATAIYITLYSPSAKEDALSWIRFKGYDPAKLEIIYVAAESAQGE